MNFFEGLLVCACSVMPDCVTLWTVATRLPVHGIFQVKILEWVAFLPQGDLPNSGIKPEFSALQEDSLLLGHREGSFECLL